MHAGVFETVSRRIMEFDADVIGLLRQVLVRIEQEDDSGGLLHTAMCLLATASEPVAETELLDMLGTPEAGDAGHVVWAAIPMSVWAPIYTRIRPLLAPSTSYLSLRSTATYSMVHAMYCKDRNNTAAMRETFGQYSRILADYYKPTPEDNR
jgi:hypothetical protein